MRFFLTTIIAMLLTFTVLAMTILREEAPSHMRFVAHVGENCSGFVVAKDVVLTAGHCIENELGLLSVSFPESTSLFVAPKPLEPKTRLTLSDLAFLRGDTGDAKPLSFAAKPKAHVGERGIVVGHGAGRVHQYSSPVVVERVESDTGLLVLAGIIVGGDSGSIVMLESDEAIGMVVGTRQPFPEGYAIPSDRLAAELRKFLKGKK